MNTNYPKTLDKCDEIKSKLDELSELLYWNVNQGLSDEFEKKKAELINWVEEVEFEITSYVQY